MQNMGNKNNETLVNLKTELDEKEQFLVAKEEEMF